jgi:Tfp pilus assembly protein PilE
MPIRLRSKSFSILFRKIDKPILKFPNIGFTLVELLVAFSLIVILAIVGTTIFTNLRNNSEDARRKADIDAIAKALEANYDFTAGTFNTQKILDGSAFSSGILPKPPEGGSYFGYTSAGDTGFRTCASLGGIEQNCTENSATCYCVDSTLAKYNQSSSALFMGPCI